MGLRAVPLRAMGLRKRRLGMGACPAASSSLFSQRGLCEPGLRASAGGVGWRRRRGRRLVPSGSARGVRAVVSGEPELRDERERFEHDGEYDGGEQLLHDGGRE